MMLIEMAVSAGLGTLVLGAVVLCGLHSTKGFALIANYVDLDRTSRNSLDRIISDIRQADRMTYFATNRMDFQTTDPYSGATNSLSFIYNPTTKVLTRLLNTQSTVLLTGCDYWNPKIFQRCTTTNGFDQYPVDDPSRPDLCKEVQLNWICSRSLLGMTNSTESIQSATVVIRKP
jgi:hypothetical protein